MAFDRYKNLTPGLPGLAQDAFRRDDGFVSLRWRLTVPLFAVLLAAAMITTYVVTDTLVRGSATAQVGQMQLAAGATQTSLQVLYEDLLHETTRMAYMSGVPEALLNGDAAVLQHLVEPEAAAAGLDSIAVVDAAGMEVVGLHRGGAGSGLYTPSSGADLNQDALVQAYTRDGRAGAAQMLRTADGYMLYIAQPILQGDVLLGQVLVGRSVSGVLESLRSSGLTQLALLAGDGSLLQTTFAARDDLYLRLPVTPEQVQQVFAAPGQIPAASLTLAGYPFEVIYLPFIVGQDVLGVLGVYLPSGLPYAADLGRQVLSLLMAGLAAAVVVAAYVAAARAVGRVRHVVRTTQALAKGDFGARTRMQALDEIGELGQALDVYADRVQQRQDSLRTMLRRQRRENARLTAILESMPDGIVVQDLDGRVLLINEQARGMLGSRQEFRRLSDLTAMVTDVLGPAMAPGIYALGEPQRVPLEGRTLSAQAAAILTISGKRVGTVVVLRDITDEVQREQAREDLLMQLAHDVQEPLMEMVALRSPADADAPLQRFAYEVMRNAVRLQRLIMQIRDLSDLSPEQLDVGQYPIPVEELLDAMAEEWRSTVEASDLSLQIMVFERDMHVLGDERRLRWALGNLLDNALKYTLPGGTITLIARRQSDQMASVIVQDTGVGINEQDRPHIFTRFYRGTPQRPDGSILRVPGMGQGLFISRRVLEAHGGKLAIQSEVGRGTRAVCALPLTSPVALALDGAGVLGQPLRERGEYVDVPRSADRSGGPTQ